MAAKDPRWPPRNLVFLTFQHQTAVIFSASSKSPCFFIKTCQALNTSTVTEIYSYICFFFFTGLKKSPEYKTIENSDTPHYDKAREYLKTVSIDEFVRIEVPVRISLINMLNLSQKMFYMGKLLNETPIIILLL